MLLVPARRPGRTTAARSSSGLEGEEPQPPPQQTSTAPPNAGGNSADDAEAAAVGKWAEQYKCQQPASSSASTTTSSAVAPAEDFILPVMTLRDKCKAPTESVPLQIFEPRYRLLMKLVNSSASRLFGVLLRKGDKDGGELESVGALCEMTHYVAVPERRRLFINARVIGRFETRRVIASKRKCAVLINNNSGASPHHWPTLLLQRLWWLPLPPTATAPPQALRPRCRRLRWRCASGRRCRT